MPIPKFLRDHTEIIPRNKARIAESMGRFVQENFLSPQVVARSLNQTDLSHIAGQWLATPKNSQQVAQLMQQTLPKVLDFFGQEQLGKFIQSNSVQWIQSTQINQLASQMLRAVLDNDFHQDVLQRGLDVLHQWMIKHPAQAREFTEKLFRELGVSKLAKSASWIGIDMQQRSIDSVILRIEGMLADPQHPWRLNIEQAARDYMQQLSDSHSDASLRLNQAKDALLDSPHVLNFIAGAVAILVEAIKDDLQHEHSAIAKNLQTAIVQVGENILQNGQVRSLLNERISSLAIHLSDQYSTKVIRFISERIHEWDSSEMISKIENEVGGDLHMIRVNGVVVGAGIGLILGLIRAIIEYLL